MKRKQFLIILLYLGLLLGCLGVVVLVNHLTGFQNQEETLPTTAAPLPSEPETEAADTMATPADATAGTEPDQIAWEDAYHYWQWQTPEAETEPEPEEEPYEPPRLILASDLHYISATTHDDGKAFQKMEADDDGKISHYSDEIIDALLDEAIKTAPTALILPGDITSNGELENHIRLAEKLQRVQDAGVPVLVIPGNHDINNYWNAATYFGDTKERAPYLETGEDFLEIYHAFGYDQAISHDTVSLSYIYALDDYYWMMMIDTCQYEDYNHVNGKIKPETLDWISEQLALAEEQGIRVLPVGHHNLLSQSRLYTTECTLENHLEVIPRFEEYQLPLYFSGHLHAQRIKKHRSEPSVPADAYGITEIVLSPYCLAPYQYGYLEWDLSGNLYFETRQTDIEAYARSIGSDDENLLNFRVYSTEYLKTVIRQQVSVTIHSVPDYLKEEMAQLYADLYFNYCAGNRMQMDQVTTEKNYKLWQRVSPDSKYVKEMGRMMEDVRADQHDWNWEMPGPGTTEEEISNETTGDRTDTVVR